MAYASVGPLSKNPFDEMLVGRKGVTPLWALSDLDDEKKLLNYLKEILDFSEAWSAPRAQIQLDNLLIYQGLQWLTQERYVNYYFDRHAQSNRRNPRIVLNYVGDAVEYWVSKLTRFRPAVAVNPANPEASDAEDAKIAKEVLDYIWYVNKIDDKNAQLVRLAKITGEAFRFIDFDPDIGDLHPDYAEASREGKRIPLLDSAGQQVMGESGEPLFVQKAVRIGEVRHRVVPGYRVFLDPAWDKEKCNWAIEWEVLNVDELRAQHPDKASKIKAEGGTDVFQNYGINIYKGEHDVVVYKMYHKRHPMLEKGRFIKFTRNVVLENMDLPYSHGQLPFVHFTDIDIPDDIRGRSFIQRVFPVQHQINAVASLIYKSLVLLAHPKLCVQQGQVDITQLVNEATIINYQDQPPSLLAAGVFPQELFGYLDKLEQIFGKLAGQFELSQGQAPSGVRAAKALRVIEEQEDKRAYYSTIKYNDTALVQDARMTLAVAGDFYDDTDGRLARVVGKNNEFRIIHFETANLSKAYDIRIANTTALSQSSAARIDELIELSQVRFDPNSVVPRSQFIKLLDLEALEEFKDVTTRAYTSAKTENEQMRKGAEVPEPAEYEDLIVHWTTHLQDMQSIDFKVMFPPEARDLFLKHMLMTEYLMYKKAYGIIDQLGRILAVPNELFKQKLILECSQWPVVFKMPPPMMPLGAGPIPPGGDIVPPVGAPPSPVVEPAPLDTGAPIPKGAS